MQLEPEWTPEEYLKLGFEVQEKSCHPEVRFSA